MMIYAYFDEIGKYIAIISEDTSEEEKQALKLKYDELRYNEDD